MLKNTDRQTDRERQRMGEDNNNNNMKSNSKISTTLPSSKRLLFDRRYGWVFDEWKDPSEEALAGGRGMFCILPLAKGLLKMASDSINVAAINMVKVLERPELLSPSLLQASLDDQLGKFTSCMQKSDFNLFAQKRNSTSHSMSGSSHLEIGTSESVMDKSAQNF